MLSFDELHDLFARFRRGDWRAKFQLKVTNITSDHFDQYMKLANQGDAAAQNTVGWMYDEGRGVKRDLSAALMYYHQSAKAGNMNAKTNLILLWQNNGQELTDLFVTTTRDLQTTRSQLDHMRVCPHPDFDEAMKDFQTAQQNGIL